MTPEQFAQLMQALTPEKQQHGLFFFWGIIACAALLAAIWGIMSYRLRHLEDILQIKFKEFEKMAEMQKVANEYLSTLNAEVWKKIGRAEAREEADAMTEKMLAKHVEVFHAGHKNQ